jgi:Carboxypeptidase regulatory-like domain
VPTLIFAHNPAGEVGTRMRELRRLILCGVILSTPIAILAQGNLSPRTSETEPTASSYLLPDAPKPLSIPSSTEGLDEQPAAAQSQGNSGASEAAQDSSKQSQTQDPNKANIGGSVLDTNGDVVPRATILLEGPSPGDRQTMVADENGAFQFGGLQPGIPYQITISMTDFETWKSQKIVLTPGQFFFLVDIKLKISESVTSVTVYASQDVIAAEQVRLEEKQRVLGIFPNFYVTYDPHPVPLTTKLKFRLAFKASTDPVTFFGIAFLAAIYQAGDIPAYGQGWDAYGQRVGAGILDSTTDIFFGGAIYPWLFRQDPRYFYQGTGTKKSRTLHALASPYVCKGDNGKTQPNYSSLGGDLTSGAISNLYYPDADKGAKLVFQGFLITTGVRTVNAVIQEFVLRKLTPSARHHN